MLLRLTRAGLTRAKRKVADARIPYRVPQAADLPTRLGGVLAVVYLIFNEGYLSSSGADPIRHDLCLEAIRLARLLRALVPTEPEIIGLLALMLLTEARRPARVAGGELVTLGEQDRGRWDRGLIEEGTPGPRLPHDRRPRRPAVALAELDGPVVALAAVDRLALSTYHAWHATRADLLRRLGRSGEAAEAYAAAIAATDNPAERVYLDRRRGQLG